MRSALLILALLCDASARAVLLAWNPVVTAARYTVYFGPKSHVYNYAVATTTNRFGRLSTSAGISTLPGSTYYFAVTATNGQGAESDPSNEVVFTQGYSAITVSGTVESGPTNWTYLGMIPDLSFVLPTTNYFFRSRLSRNGTSISGVVESAPSFSGPWSNIFVIPSMVLTNTTAPIRALLNVRPNSVTP